MKPTVVQPEILERHSTPLADPVLSERSPLAELLQKSYIPPWLKRQAIIKCPQENLPSRLWVVDWMWRWGHVPGPALTIEWGTIFCGVTVPMTGICYAGCTFYDCDIEPPSGPYEVIGSLIEESPLMHRGFSKYGWVTLAGNLIKYPPD